MTVRRPVAFSEVTPSLAEFSDPNAGLVTNIVHEGTTAMPSPTPAQTALQRLTESLPSEAETQRLAGDYAETPHLFAADASAEFALALDAQRSTAEGGLPGWLDALDRGSRH